MTELSADWIDSWADLYERKNPGYDDAVLTKVGARVSQRGAYDRADLLEVGRWKSARALPSLGSNTDAMIADITRTAFIAPEAIQHRVVALLHGVGIPMASSLLMVWQTDVHTVIDVRAVKSLVAHGVIDDPGSKSYPPYMDYLTACRAIRDRCKCSLRRLDRALYQANGATRTAS